MREFDDVVLKAFLKKQTQLFDEEVAVTLDEADEFLTDLMAVVCNNEQEVIEYFEEEGLDMETAEGKNILDADEVFEIGDGRYLIVEG